MTTPPEEPQVPEGAAAPTPPPPPAAPTPPAAPAAGGAAGGAGGADLAAAGAAAKAAYGDAVSIAKTGSLAQKLGLAAGVLGIITLIAALLPWVHVSVPGFSKSASGVSGGNNDGVFTLLLGLAAGGLGVAYALKGLLQVPAAIASAVAGLIITIIAAVDISDASDGADQLRSFAGGFGGVTVKIDAGASFGLYLTLLCGLAFIAVGALSFLQTRKTS